MSANRPPAVTKKVYIELDEQYLREGKLVPIGAPIIAPTVTSSVPRGKFEIVYTAELFGILERLGNKKIEVLSYLLENKDSNNCLNMTNVEIAENINVSRKTVVETIKILQDANLVRKKHSLLMFSPNLMVKGNQQREAYLMRKYVEIGNNMEALDPPTQNVINATVDEQYTMDLETGEIIQRAK